MKAFVKYFSNFAQCFSNKRKQKDASQPILIYAKNEHVCETNTKRSLILFLILLRGSTITSLNVYNAWSKFRFPADFIYKLIPSFAPLHARMYHNFYHHHCRSANDTLLHFLLVNHRSTINIRFFFSFFSNHYQFPCPTNTRVLQSKMTAKSIIK